MLQVFNYAIEAIEKLNVKRLLEEWVSTGEDVKAWNGSWMQEQETNAEEASRS